MFVLLDTNILIDALLRRAPWHAEAAVILQLSATRPLDLAVSSLSVANLFYIGRRIVGAEQARLNVRQCLADFVVLSVDRQTLAKADEMPGTDFEDNVQMAVATRAGVDFIVTRDSRGFVNSPVAACSPAEFLQRHAQVPP